MMHHYYGYLFGFGGNIVMFLIFIVLIILLIWAIASAGRRGHYWHDYHNSGQSPRNPGLDVLNERYAKGEITKEEYEQKKKDILA